MIGTCLLCLSALGVLGKTICLASGLKTDCLGFCMGFWEVEVYARISPRCFGPWKAFVTFFLCSLKM